MSLLAPLHTFRAAPDAASAVRLGMPHLTPAGLSETWLLKHLGDVHWQLLAARLGRPAAVLEDQGGRRVYAAFRSVLIEDARLAHAQEDARLSIASSLWRGDGARLVSRHALACGDRALGIVTLISAFIRRAGTSNRKVARVEVPGLALLPAAAAAPPAAAWDATRGRSGRFVFTPCPSEDFNGAGFLYFASYVAIAERAAFALDPRRAAAATTLRRSIAYHANMDAGDAVCVETQEHGGAAGRWRLACELRRMSDGVLLARMTTEKALPTGEAEL